MSEFPLPNYSLDFVDYPTGWHLAREVVPAETHHLKCSYKTTNGAVLCDCGQIERAWEQVTGKRLETEPYGGHYND